MILPVNNINSASFAADSSKKDMLLKNNFSTRTRIATDKISNALTLYPAKGLSGNKNFNFYEFLTLGIVPYIAGSLTLIGVFNAANKYYPPPDRKAASVLGKKLALGVIFYGILKGISKSFVTTPVRMLTGVDTEVPYSKVVYRLPDNVNDTDITSFEYHKVFESVDFARWDLLYNTGQQPNAYYDKVAKKLGMGEGLKDSDQGVKPRIREIVTRTNIAKSISSYLWAAVGVAFAFQKPWETYVDGRLGSMKVLGQSFRDSLKSFYSGYAGKILLGVAAASTVLGVMNAVKNPNKPSKKEDPVIDKGREYVTA